MTHDTRYSPRYNGWSDGYPPDWDDRRRVVLDRDSHRCSRCGVKSLPENDVGLDVHHLKPRSAGGSHSLDNLAALCRECHARAHPGNRELALRAGLKPAWLRLVLWILGLLGLLGKTKAGGDVPEDRLHLDAYVVELWEPHEKMQQVGLLSTSDSKFKFVVWKDQPVRDLVEGLSYEVEYAVLDEYRGEPQVVLDRYTDLLEK